MYADHFHDDLAFAATFFVRTDGHDASDLPGSALADASALAPLLAAHGRATGAVEPRAIASQWSKWAFARLVIPTVVLQCSLDRALDFSAVDWSFSCDADGTPVRFMFASDPFLRPGTGHDFGSLIDHALVPLIAALESAAGLSPRVYASNAAMYYVWAIERLLAQARAVARPLARAFDLTQAPRRPDGGFNPFNRAHRRLPPGAIDGEGAPADTCRRLCCVRDLDPVWGLCSNCPRAVTLAAAPALATTG